MPEIYGMPLFAWGALVTATVATFALIVNFFSSRRQQKSDRARVFGEIADRWSKIYSERNYVLGTPILTIEVLRERYQDDYKKFLTSEEWLHYRGVCNFFEYLGVVLYEGFIDPGPLFVLVTVDVYKDVVDGKQLPVELGVMYNRLQGPIQYLREKYRWDIYVFYDYLRKRYKRHRPMLP